MIIQIQVNLAVIQVIQVIQMNLALIQVNSAVILNILPIKNDGKLIIIGRIMGNKVSKDNEETKEVSNPMELRMMKTDDQSKYKSFFYKGKRLSIKDLDYNIRLKFKIYVPARYTLRTEDNKETTLDEVVNNFESTKIVYILIK
jgi:hypothetical protein